MRTEKRSLAVFALRLALLAPAAGSAATIQEWTTSLFAGAPGQPAVVDGAAGNARFSAPGEMTSDGTYLWLGDGSTVRRIELATAQVFTIAGSTSPGVVDNPIGSNARFGSLLAVARSGSTLWVTDPSNGRIRAVSTNSPFAVTTVAGSSSGTVVDGFGTAAVLESPRAVAHYNGFLYFTDAGGTVVRRFDPATTAVVTLAGTPNVTGSTDGCGSAATFISIRNIAADGAGKLYLSDTNGSRIRTFDIATNCVTPAVGNGVNGHVDGPIATAQVNRPRGIAADGESIFWVEFNQHTVRQAILGGTVVTLAGAACADVSLPCLGGYVEGVGMFARFNGPWGFARDPASGAMFVYDTGNFVIRRMSAAATNLSSHDFNGDARSDVLWRSSTGGLVYQWQMNGLALSGQGYMPSVPNNWAVGGVGDASGDGNADVFWREATGLNYLWIVSGLGITSQGYLPSVPNPWIVVGMGDANADGRADVFWRNPTSGQNYLWVMNGLSITSQAYLPSVTGSDWEVVGVADYSGDGKADALWRNKTTGQNYLWVMNGLVVASQGFLPSVAGSDWEVVGSPDANGDGKADVLWRHKTTGQNYLWVMNGLTVSSQGYLPSVADANWKVVGYGDYNGDGRGDVLWRHATTGQNYLWTLNGFTVTTQGYLPSVAGSNWQPTK